MHQGLLVMPMSTTDPDVTSQHDQHIQGLLVMPTSTTDPEVTSQHDQHIQAHFTNTAYTH